jgi:hypothetical protein
LKRFVCVCLEVTPYVNPEDPNCVERFANDHVIMYDNGGCLEVDLSA